MITKILLINFQKHASLELNFSKDINVITGLTDSGKTCLFHALEWVCGFSDLAEIDYRKEGTKQTSVKIWLDSGFEVERIRSASINRYILSKNDSNEKVFDSIGKTPPEEIQDVLGMKEIEVDGQKINLNFASQDDLNFLLDKNISGTFKAKLFNKLTGNEKLDIIYKECNKDSLRLSRDIKSVEENIEKQENELGEYSLKYKDLKKKLNSVTEKYGKIKEDIKIYEELKVLATKLNENKEAEDFVKFKASKIGLVSDEKIKDLKAQVEHFNYVSELMNKSITIHNKLAEIEEKKIKIVDVDFDDLKNKANNLHNLNDYVQKMNDLKRKEDSLTLQIKKCEKDSVKIEEELKEVWCQCGDICPLCKQEKNHENTNNKTINN